MRRLEKEHLGFSAVIIVLVLLVGVCIWGLSRQLNWKFGYEGRVEEMYAPLRQEVKDLGSEIEALKKSQEERAKNLAALEQKVKELVAALTDLTSKLKKDGD